MNERGSATTRQSGYITPFGAFINPLVTSVVMARRYNSRLVWNIKVLVVNFESLQWFAIC